jgi:hypothetical protein
MVELFDKVGLGQWFRYLTGLLEVKQAPAITVRRGNQSGSELDDWLQAEKEFLQDEAIDEEAAEMFGQP